jgi:transcriptional regulator with XRE-family HTH domain
LSIGKVLKSARISLGLSQSEVAKKAGIAAAQLSQIESDNRPDPQFSTIIKIARVLDLSLDDLAMKVAPGGISRKRQDSKRISQRLKKIVASVDELRSLLQTFAEDFES